jgi:hypothetical protein
MKSSDICGYQAQTWEKKKTVAGERQCAIMLFRHWQNGNFKLLEEEYEEDLCHLRHLLDHSIYWMQPRIGI